MTKRDDRSGRDTARRGATKPRSRKTQSPSQSAKSPPSDRKQDYEVGYGKPPKSAQFKPGQSGNPRGRPKGNRNAKNLLREALNTKVTARIGGKTKRVTALQGMTYRFADIALKCTPSQLQAMFKVMHQLGLFDENEETDNSIRLSPQEQIIFDEIIGKLDEDDNDDC